MGYGFQLTARDLLYIYTVSKKIVHPTVKWLEQEIAQWKEGNIYGYIESDHSDSEMKPADTTPISSQGSFTCHFKYF